jgi:diguanylate cyclase (GGDEF)-like protein/PAS domain S-box-containing protein
MNQRPQMAGFDKHSMGRLALAVGSLFVAYFAAALFGIELVRWPDHLGTLWIANAVGVSFLVRRDGREWPACFAAIFLASLSANLVGGYGVAGGLGFTAANLVECAVAAFLLRAWLGRDIVLDVGLTTYVRVLAVAALAAPAIAALVAGLVGWLAFEVPFQTAWWFWLRGSALGAIVVLPVALSATPGALRRTFGPERREFVVLGLASAAIMAAAIAFIRYPFVLFSLPLAVAAFRTNPFATALISMVSVATVVVLRLLGWVHEPPADGTMLEIPVALYAGLAIVMPFFVSLLVEQQRRESARVAESEERFRNAMEHSAIGMALVGRDGAFLKVNHALCEMLGYTTSEFRALKFQAITHPDDLAGDLERVERVLSGEMDSFRMEKRYVRKDGGLVWAQLAVSCVRDKSGDALYFVSQIEDITARKAAEDALEESESRWNFALESARQGVWDHNLVTGRAFYSPVWKSLFGYMPDEFGDAGDAWEAMVHPDDRDRVMAHNRDVLAGESDEFESEYRMRHRDGRWIWVLDRGRVIERDSHGAPIRMIGTYTDITRRREAEAALEASESRWSFALESARQGVWDVDVPGGKTFYSATWGAILGYTADETGKDDFAWVDLVHPDDLPGMNRRLEEYGVAGGDFFEAEFRMRHKDGRWVWILDRGTVAHRDGEGRPLRIIGTHTDVTARKEAEAQIALLSQRVQMAVRAGGVGLWDYNTITGDMWWDARMSELYGVDPADRTGKVADWLERIHPDDRERVAADGREAGGGRRPYDTEFRIVTPAGVVRHIKAQAEAERDGEGRPIYWFGTNWDITETRTLTDALFQEKERLQITLQSIGDAVISTDTQSRITFMNTVAEELTGWSADDAGGQPFNAVVKMVAEASDEAAPSAIAACLAGEVTTTTRDDVRILSRKGLRDIRETAAPVRTAAGEIVGVVLIFQDMTDARLLQRQLSHSASHDALTGLSNRASFEVALTQACSSADESGRQHAVCFIDLDRFKIVNDTAGHAAGDALLSEIGGVIRNSVRGGDVTARLGGDEFGLLLYDCPADHAEFIADKLIQSIRAVPFAWEGRAYDIGASIGLAVVSAGSAVPGEVLSQADIACYTAKGLGRNRVAVYRAGESEARRQHRDLQVAARIRGAIENGEFQLFGQEIRRLQPGSVSERHYEILLRMFDDDGSLLDPDAFIPAAERYDLMANIDRWVIGRVLGEYGSRLAAEPDLSISINLSANSLNDPRFWPFLESQLAASALPAERLRLEITETSLINNLSASSFLVQSARGAGCAIVLDDFGTGLSSFAYLKRFPIDYLKIDGSFMRKLASNPVDRTIVESINDIAHKLGAATIAEWVEDAETAEILRAIGVDHAQGFAIARPVPLDEVLHVRPTGATTLRKTA